MENPAPQVGPEISYADLGHREHRTGREEGRKDRPCVIVVAIRRADDGDTLVRVMPVTHSVPAETASAMEIPPAVKLHLGLDAERSWIILDELNEFVWPGFDLRPISRSSNRIDYGILLPRLFDMLIAKLDTVWRQAAPKAVSRD